MYKTLLFDLDGTLTDSSRGITNSVAYALEKYGLPYKNKKELECFIGPPLVKMFMSKFGLGEAEGLELLALYREYYSVRESTKTTFTAGYRFFSKSFPSQAKI